MNTPDILQLLDTAVTATVLGLWVWSERQRAKSLRESLRQWRRWYRQDMRETLEVVTKQQESQERQQAQTEALIDEHVS